MCCPSMAAATERAGVFLPGSTVCLTSPVLGLLRRHSRNNCTKMRVFLANTCAFESTYQRIGCCEEELHQHADTMLQIKMANKRDIKDSLMTGGGAVKAKLLDMNTQGGSRPPKILYCSRTHSQIQQVVQEMKKTKYKNTSCDSASQQYHHVHAYHSPLYRDA